MSVPSFMLHTPCSEVDPDDMFPKSSDTAGVKFAKDTCAPCPFQAECLEWALDPASRCVFGVFGALTGDERKEMIKERNLGNAVRPDYGKLPPKSQRIPAAA
ncbi:WhiB family transcriptional regulator [Streptomyces sp. NPDC003016]